MSVASMQSVLHTHLSGYRQRHRLSPRQYQVCHHIMGCRTESMGSVRLQCTHCEQTQLHHYACRDRHCPKCQHRASVQWGKKQSEALLPVTYHHVVFTLPSELNGWVGLHPETIYRLFFDNVWSTLRRFGENPKHLGGEIGVTSVLHTWGENLSRHVHIHCLIPGGALNGKWIAARGNYLFPVRALSRRLRGCMVSALREASRKGELHRIKACVDETLTALMDKEWVVYSKPCEGRSKQVVDYLSRYTHRIAISDTRIVSVEASKVEFTYKDYNDGEKRKTLCLSADEFIRRFLLHVLPKGLVRIRHYGLLSNRNRREKIALIRALLLDEEHSNKAPTSGTTESTEAYAMYPCRRCKVGHLVPSISQCVDQGGPPGVRLMH